MQPTDPNIPLMGLIARLMRQHHYNSHLSLKDQDVHPGQPPVLFALARHDGMSQRELAHHIRVKPATLTVMLNRMVKNGHVTRRTDPKDSRVSRVFLTEKGRLAVAEVRAALDASERSALAGVTEDEQAMLRRIIAQMYHNVLQQEQIISRQTKEVMPQHDEEDSLD